jgi:hypothetical protein
LWVNIRWTFYEGRKEGIGRIDNQLKRKKKTTTSQEFKGTGCMRLQKHE